MQNFSDVSIECTHLFWWIVMCPFQQIIPMTMMTIRGSNATHICVLLISIRRYECFIFHVLRVCCYKKQIIWILLSKTEQERSKLAVLNLFYFYHFLPQLTKLSSLRWFYLFRYSLLLRFSELNMLLPIHDII